MSDLTIRSRNRGLTPMHGVAIGGFGAVGFLLIAMGIPTVFLVFLGLISYFSWKAFASIGESANRPIFEFYLKCDRVLAGKGSPPYGFEITEAIAKGVEIRTLMPDPPPLVLFGLSELYLKRSDLTAASECLNAAIDAESRMVLLDDPSNELREHVASLRVIETSSDDAPTLRSAIRRLERKFRRKLSETSFPHIGDSAHLIGTDVLIDDENFEMNDGTSNRRSISDVLHDIYDRN